MTAMTPTKKQMLAVLKRRIEYSTYGGKEGDGPICDAIRSLIEHGDGGPKVTKDQIFDLMQQIDAKRSYESPGTKILTDWLRSTGVTVEEE